MLSGDKMKKNEIGRACGTYGRQERSVQGFGGKNEVKRPLRKPRHRWEDNIKMNPEEKEGGDGLE